MERWEYCERTTGSRRQSIRSAELSLTPPGELQPGATFPDTSTSCGGLAPVRFELLDLGLGDGVLGAPVEAADWPAVLVEGELQRRVPLLRVQARLAAQHHATARLLRAQRPEHRCLKQLCGEGGQEARMLIKSARGVVPSQGQPVHRPGSHSLPFQEGSREQEGWMGEREGLGR